MYFVLNGEGTHKSERYKLKLYGLPRRYLISRLLSVACLLEWCAKFIGTHWSEKKEIRNEIVSIIGFRSAFTRFFGFIHSVSVIWSSQIFPLNNNGLDLEEESKIITNSFWIINWRLLSVQLTSLYQLILPRQMFSELIAVLNLLFHF